MVRTTTMEQVIERNIEKEELKIKFDKMFPSLSNLIKNLQTSK